MYTSLYHTVLHVFSIAATNYWSIKTIFNWESERHFVDLILIYSRSLLMTSFLFRAKYSHLIISLIYYHCEVINEVISKKNYCLICKRTYQRSFRSLNRDLNCILTMIRLHINSDWFLMNSLYWVNVQNCKFMIQRWESSPGSMSVLLISYEDKHLTGIEWHRSIYMV